MTLTNGGYLGIGTTAPNYPLVVSSGNAAGVEISPSGGINSGAFLQCYNRATSAYVPFTTYASEMYWSLGGTQVMKLDSSGNLGIGTSSPTTLVTMLGTTSKQSILRMQAASGGTGGFKRNTIQMRDDTGAAGYDIVQLGDGGNALTFDSVAGSTPTTRITFDSSGHLGIGAAPPAGVPLYVSNSGAYAWLDTTTSGYSNVTGFDNGVQRWAVGQSAFGGANGMQFFSGTTEGMRLDSSGNLLVGTTSAGTTNSNSLTLEKAGYSVINHASGTASGFGYTIFGYNGTLIGSITQSGTTAVLYNTTSDRRLKDNITDADSASDLIDAIKVRQFDWKADGSHQRYGMIAQELHEVAPEAVHSPADPDDMMAVDYSKLVPMLVKEIQSLRVRLNALENK
jgi:hypothetical protein